MARTLKCDANRREDLAQQLCAAWRHVRRHGDQPEQVALLLERAEDAFDSDSPDSVIARAMSLCSPQEAASLSRWLADEAMNLGITLGNDGPYGHVQLFAIPVFGADTDIYRAFKGSADAHAICQALRETGLLAPDAAATICTGVTFPLDAAISISPGQLRFITERMAAILVSPEDCEQETQELQRQWLACGAEVVPHDPNPCTSNIVSRLVIGARLLLEPEDAQEQDEAQDDFFSGGMDDKDQFGAQLQRWLGLVNSSGQGLHGVSVGAPGVLTESLVDANLQYLNGAMSIELAKSRIAQKDAPQAVPHFVQGADESEVSLVVGEVVLGPIIVPNALISLDPQAFASEVLRLGNNPAGTAAVLH